MLRHLRENLDAPEEGDRQLGRIEGCGKVERTYSARQYHTVLIERDTCTPRPRAAD